MNEGDLLSFLRKKRESKSFKYKMAVKICLDIVKGCKYLEDMQIIHRDIAARNCLVHIKRKNIETNKEVDDEDLNVKLGDFGFAREIYMNDYYRQSNDQKPLPIRWMAPESIIDGIFTTHSDIWSFGVVVWEIMTLGQQPYSGMENKEVIEHIRKGGLLSIPDKCPNEMFVYNFLLIEFLFSRFTFLHLENRLFCNVGTETVEKDFLSMICSNNCRSFTRKVSFRIQNQVISDDIFNFCNFCN